jgi:hypothetical protein
MLVAMCDVELHPAGPDLGLRALRASIDRLHEAWTTRGEGDWRISASAGEALLWIAALDNYMVIQDQKRGTGYRTRRDADPLGEVVRALAYARDALGHGLSMVSSFVYELGSPGIVQGDNVLKEASGPWLTIHFRWASITKLPNRRQDATLDRLYEQRVANRPLSHPLDEAHRFFEGEAARL